MIYQHHLDFMEEAKRAFEANERWETYRNKDNTLIALRYGMDRNCMQIYELGNEVGFFAEVMNKAPELVVKSTVDEEWEKFFWEGNQHLRDIIENNFFRINYLSESENGQNFIADFTVIYPKDYKPKEEQS